MYIGQNSRILIGCTTMLMLDAARGSATCPQRQPGEPSVGGCALQQPWADYTQIGLSDNLVGSSCIVSPARRYAESGMSDSVLCWAVLAVYLKTVTCRGFAMLTINLRSTPD
jgi:hypothetical protein